MKRMNQTKHVITFLLVLLLALGFGFGTAGRAYAADDEGYTYTVKIYSGKEGYFGSKDKHVVTVKGLAYNQSYTVDVSDLGLVVKDPGKYYVRGLKLAGHDNDEISNLNYQSYTFKVTGDMSFSVAYGMKGGMVKYTVRYEDATGNKLLDPQEFYGMAGDKPVVSYQYVEGYRPNAYNLGKTLTATESDNVFTFTYTKLTEAEQGGQGGNGEQGGNGGQSGQNQGGDNGGQGQGGDNGTGDNGGTGLVTPGNAGGQGDEPQEYIDLDDPAAPQAENPDGKKDGLGAGVVFGGAAIVLVLAAIAGYLLFRRKAEE